MQKLSQTEELARSLAAKAHRHTLTTEQISRAMEEADFDIAQLDELYAAQPWLKLLSPCTSEEVRKA